MRGIYLAKRAGTPPRKGLTHTGLHERTKVYFFREQIVTSVFSIIGTGVGFYITSAVWHDFMYGHHWLTNAWARVGVAYYFYDTLVKMQCTFHEYGDPKRELNIFYKIALFLKHDPLMFFHHIILPPLIFPCILIHRKGMHDIVFAVSYAFDVPVPFIQLRFILYRLDLKNSWLYVINGLLMTITFGIFRVLVFPWIVSVYAQRYNLTLYETVSRSPLSCSITMGTVCAMQTYWLCLMVRGVMKFFIEREHVQVNGSVTFGKRKED